MPYEPESIALFNRMSSAPSDLRKGTINRLIKGLKSAGIWSKLDLFYILAAHDSQASKLNWIADAYNLTESGTPVFTANRGWEGASPGADFLLTGFQIYDDAVQASQNDAHIWSWHNGQTSEWTSRIGGVISSGGDLKGSLIRIDKASLDIIGLWTGLNSSDWILDITNTAALNWNGGLCLLNRDNASDYQVYLNNALKFDQTMASWIDSPTEFYGAAHQFGASIVSQNIEPLNGFGVGASLTDEERFEFYSLLNEYYQAVLYDNEHELLDTVQIFGEVKNWDNKIIRVEIIRSMPAETETLFDRMNEAECLPEFAKQNSIIKLLETLINEGVWAKTELFYILTAECENAAALNWKSINHSLTKTGTPTWLGSWQGYSGSNGNHLTSGMPVNQATLMSQINAHIWGYGLGDLMSLGAQSTGSNGFQLARAQQSSNEVHNYALNSTGNSVAPGVFHPFMAASRTESNNKNIYYAGAGSPDFKEDNVSDTIASLPSGTFRLLTQGGAISGGGGDQSTQLLGGGMGAALTSAQIESLYDALKLFYSEVM